MNDSPRTFLSMPAQPLPEGPVADEPKENKLLLALVAVAALVVVAGGAWFFLLSGSDADPVSASATATGTTSSAAPSAVATPEPTAESTAEAGTTSQASNAKARDPFKPLVYEKAASEATTAAVEEQTVTAGGSPASSSPTTAPTPTPSATTDTTSGATPAAAPSGSGTTTGVELTLSAVKADNAEATVRTGTENYTVTPGESFADGFVALSFDDGSCGTFTYDGQRFALCESQSITIG